jgi:hypothetical protein
MGWVVSVTPRPRFTPEERTPGTHCTGGWVDPRAGLDTEARGKMLLPLRAIEPRSPGRPVRSHTILTELPRLLKFIMRKGNLKLTHIFYGENIFFLNLHLRRGRAMAQAVSRWPLTVEARVRVRVDPCGICGGQSGRFFSEFFGFPLPVSSHHCSIFIYHRPMRCAIAPTKHHTITTSVLS